MLGSRRIGSVQQRLQSAPLARVMTGIQKTHTDGGAGKRKVATLLPDRYRPPVSPNAVKKRVTTQSSETFSASPSLELGNGPDSLNADVKAFEETSGKQLQGEGLPREHFFASARRSLVRT